MFEQIALTFTAGVMVIVIARAISWRIAGTGAVKALIRFRAR